MKKLNLTTAALCLTFLMGGACASELTKFTTETPTVKVGDYAMLFVEGTAKCGVMVKNGAGESWPISLGDVGPDPIKVFGTKYALPGIYTVEVNQYHSDYVKEACLPMAKPLTLKIEVVGATPEATKPGTPPKTFVPASIAPAKPTPPCAKDEVAQARQLQAGIKVDICPPTKPTTPTCAPDEAAQTRMLQAGVRVEICPPTKPTTPTCAPDKAAQARQLKAGIKVDICEPPKSDTPPTCFKSKSEQSEYSKKNNPKTVPPICK